MGWLALVLGLAVSGQAVAEIEWPQEIKAPEGTIVVYQPQPERMDGNSISGRAAIALELKKRDEPIFGAMWFTARIDTDLDTRIVTVRDLKVTKVGWPDSKDAGEQRFTAIVEGAVPAAGFTISLDRLSASLASSEREQKSLEQLKTDPPKIVFRDSLAVLLLFDGPPRFSPVENSDYERAMNAPLVVARNKKTKDCYLSSGVLWYTAKDPLGPWSPTDNPPADLVKMLPRPDDKDTPPQTPPEIVVATEPTELICSAGKPDWQSLPGGSLLYVKNTETPWVRELSTGNMYLLLSGRWYRSRDDAGPWTFVRADELPASFKEIPPASDLGGVRTSVAGTEEAEDAMLDASIPQTAVIDRSKATLEVKYDGEPEFEAVPGTQVAYAVNSVVQVLKVGERYYAVDNGVWFTSAAATGPWVVADSIPKNEIDKIPPSSPVYNTTYVNIYESTPQYVTVGYYPGYLWSFPYYGVPVYGTGWYYPPYWGSYYTPRPPTWGFHVGYNPWTGWNFGVSWTAGFFSFGVSWGGGYPGYYRPWGGCGGWYGGGYRGPVIINTGDINIGNSINSGNRTRIANEARTRPELAGKQPGTRNLYNREGNRARTATPAQTRELKQARSAPKRANDVYADKNGNVARRAGDGWERRDQGSWKPEPAPQTRDRVAPTRPSSPGLGSPGLDRSGLDRSYRGRQSGMARERSYGGGGGRAPRGGGGRRR